MLRIVFVSMFLLGCQQTQEVRVQWADSEPPPKKQVGTPSDPPEPPVKTCEVEREVSVKDCHLYYFKCEDGSNDLAVLCEIQPIGHITNPPRPIFPYESMNP
jgi:hypothetical protein